MGDFEEALANFNDTLLYLRGNNSIDYDQLGLKFKLFACETLFNRGLCYIYLQQMDAGMQDLGFAANEKATEDHEVIDEAIRERAEVCRSFHVPESEADANRVTLCSPSRLELSIGRMLQRSRT